MFEETAEIVKEFVYCILFSGGKMTPTLYYIPASPPCRTILLLGKMLDLQFELKLVNVLQGEQMKPEFIEMNPQHCVPTMKDQELVLWESRAILSFLVSAYGKDDSLYPKDIRIRALVDQRMQFDLGTLYLRMTDYYFPTIFMGAHLDESKKSKLLEALGWLDVMLKGKRFVAAEHFTIADLTLLVTVAQIEEFGFEMSSCKNVKQWLQRCKDQMAPFDYEEINNKKSVMLGDMFRAKINLK